MKEAIIGFMLLMIGLIYIGTERSSISATVVDEGHTHPHEILDPILDKIVKEKSHK